MAFHHQSQGYQLANYPAQGQEYDGGGQQWEAPYGSQTALSPHHNTPPNYNVVDSKPGAGSGGVGAHPWKSGLFARFPWWGVASLLLSIFCTVAAVVLLRHVDGRPVSEWSSNLQPSVILAYSSTVGNALMTASLAEAATIYFWRRALQGANIMDLHYNWLGGHGLWGGIKSIFKWRAVLVSVGCVLVGVTGLLRGPLLQRAAAVETRTTMVDGNLDVGIATTIPETWGSQIIGRANNIIGSSNFSRVLTQYQNRENIQLLTPPCDNCTLAVKGFGFNVSCTDSTQSYEVTHNSSATVDIFSSNASAAQFQTGATARTSVFGYVLVQTVVKEEPTCEGELKLRTCRLNPSTMLYDLTMTGSNVSFISPSWTSDTYVSTVNLTHYQVIPSLGGVTGALNIFGYSLFEAAVQEIYQGARGFTVAVTGSLGHTYMSGRAGDGDQQGCNYTFKDPMDDIINSFRELALRMSVQLAQEDGARVQAAVPYSARRMDTIYVVDYRNLGIAVLVSLLGPLALLPLFWGWWSLGRSVSMSPVETANAIGGGRGVFSGVGANATPDEMMDVLGQRSKVRYGVVARTGRLALAEDDGEIRAPSKGEML